MQVLSVQSSTANPSINRLLAALSDGAFALLQPYLKQAVLSEGTVCHCQGDPIDQVYFPETGMISLLVATGEGAMIETSAVGREGAVGLQAGLSPRTSYARAVVQIAGRFTVVPAHRLEHVAKASPAVGDLIVRYIERRWAEAQQNAACNAVHDASSRLCRWLLQSADRVGSNQVLLTHEFLAGMLGLRRTSVTLLAQELRQHGLVRYGRGRITILDRAGLEKRACECYEITKDDGLLAPALHGTAPQLVPESGSGRMK